MRPWNPFAKASAGTSASTRRTSPTASQFVDGLDDLPHGLDTSKWQWVDLDGEGMAGLLTQSPGGWFYKRNEGQGKLGAVQRLGSRPNLSLGAPGTRLVDLGGDGKLDVVVMRPDLAGYQERTLDGGWEAFKRFPNRLTQSLDDPDARLIDLDGDGIADVLITEGNVFTWYPSKAKDGFDKSRRTFQPRDENQGPRVVFSNDGESIFLGRGRGGACPSGSQPGRAGLGRIVRRGAQSPSKPWPGL